MIFRYRKKKCGGKKNVGEYWNDLGANIKKSFEKGGTYSILLTIQKQGGKTMNGDFTLYTPTKVVFGHKTEQKAGELVRAFGGSRVLIHYGGSSAVRSGLIDRVKASLDEAGVFHVELGGVVPNPQLAKVYEGIELAKDNGVLR